ncbi:hypothetical protein DFH08DRAFT_953382 [Mycena albidolilacea]|uniref:BTB domain-containing protein n=1 Tax=Mycena albidolilacea TaxID=1033008 RepID=A0AAD7EZB5_9AGAR|nr:hypothetical protein DFH08DRAFT_953382 [Mycena albidolilacea]
MSDSDSDSNPADPHSSQFIPSSPFNDTDADVILRSSDGVDFHVYRLVLSLASSVFRDMFAFPTPQSEPTIPTVQVSESALVLDAALRFWYPGAEPTAVQTLDLLRDALEVLVLKYNMRFVIPLAKQQLREYIGSDPVAVFSIACRHEWKDIALDAAKGSLKLPLRAFDEARPAQLEYMTAGTYHTLLQYHSECAKVATAATSSLQWATYLNIPGADCTNWTDPAACPRTGHWSFAHSTMAPLTAWFSTYLDGATAVLSRCPTASLDSPDLLTLPIAKMGPCSSCRVDGFSGLIKFLDVLRAKIDKDIGSIELELNF